MLMLFWHRLLQAGLTAEQMAEVIDSGNNQLAQSWLAALPQIMRDAEQQERQAQPAPSPVNVLDYFQPLADSDLEGEDAQIAAALRRMGLVWGYDFPDRPVVWDVQPGWMLKNHAARTSFALDGYDYLQGWNFDDTATRRCRLFGIPRLVPESTNLNPEEQLELVTRLCTQFDLPTEYFSSLGSLQLGSGLIMAHCALTEERIPLDLNYVRTDTLLASGRRLSLGNFYESGLYCGGYCGGGVRYNNLGVFALMV